MRRRRTPSSGLHTVLSSIMLTFSLAHMITCPKCMGCVCKSLTKDHPGKAHGRERS